MEEKEATFSNLFLSLVGGLSMMAAIVGIAFTIMAVLTSLWALIPVADVFFWFLFYAIKKEGYLK